MMMRSIFKQTFTNAFRQKHLQVLAPILILLYLVVAFNSVVAYKTKMQSFEKAKISVRKAWLNQGPQNPHNSAHYGHYIFQPVNEMHLLDNGIRSFAGSILRLEAHAQNEITFSPAADKTELSRFGDMSFAWMLQVLIPLFIILLCFNSICSDRENQNLKLLLAQGISLNNYIWGKIFSLFTIILCLAVVGIVIQLLVYLVFAKGIGSFDLTRIVIWFLSYVVYFFILTGLSVLTSAWIKKSNTSLVIQLSCWITLMIVMPKITASAGVSIYPMEHKSVFNKALREDREKGIDGHNPEDERAKYFMDSIIAYYKIDTNKVKDVYAVLPVNVDGLVMQADEDYANLVYDKHFKRVYETIIKQNSISKYASFVNPFLAIRNISMGISQSDFSCHLELLFEAEQYRRYLIKNLNDKMTYGGSKTGDWEWKVDAKYWETVKDFSYPSIPLMKNLKSNSIELSAMFFWIILLIISVTLTTNKLTVL